MLQRFGGKNETLRSLLAFMALVVPANSRADSIHLNIEGLVTDATGGSFVVTARPYLPIPYIPGAYAINLQFSELSNLPNPIAFQTANVLTGMIELGENVGTTPHPGTFSEGDVIQYVAGRCDRSSGGWDVADAI